MIKKNQRKEDRRVVRRHPAEIEIEWEGLVGRQTGTVSDISSLGCFVLCSGEVENGENVKLFFPIAEGMKAQLWGEVVNHVVEIGYGVKFIEVNAAQRKFIEKIVASSIDE